MAAAGGVCVSEQVFDQVRNKISEPLLKLAPKDLKNVRFSVDVYKVVMPWEESASLEETRETPKTFRLAVLPFRNMSPDPNDEYFADGITEELITSLSSVKALTVIARTSVMQYKTGSKRVSEIGRELNAGTLIEGSVRKAGNRVRVTVQLIDAKNEGHLWAQNYDRQLDDIFAIQSEIAEKVSSSLQVQLLEEDKKRIEKGGTSSVKAHTLYLKGTFQLSKWDKASLLTAIAYFEQAVADDPNYALAYTGMSFAYSKLRFQDLVDPEEALEKGEKYAKRALDLNESLPEAHLADALWPRNRYDLAGTERQLRRAIELNPNLAQGHIQLASNLAFRGKMDECLREVEKVLELDPFSVETNGRAGTQYLYSGHYDKAIRFLNNSLELDPTNSFYLGNLGLAHLQKGMVEEGLAEVKRAADMSKTPGSYADLAYAYVKAGRPEEARKILDTLLEL
ncbi:MAG: tetratricopeptide repeat protein, partial [Nitrososphaerales archaeon]